MVHEWVVRWVCVPVGMGDVVQVVVIPPTGDGFGLMTGYWLALPWC